ncbi:MAG: hypothetical protein LBT94_02335, partial [Prevotellaceae bacterium]|nr:hypothetical protein [Prevotellaceae bacterium]
MTKTIFKHLLLFAAVVAMSWNARGETRTITITVNSIESGGGTLSSSSSYNDAVEKAWTQDGVSFAGKAIKKGTGGNAGAIQARASEGLLYNTTPLSGKIVSITITSTGTARSSSCYGGSSQLVSNDLSDYNVNNSGTPVGSTSDTGWTAEDFSGTSYTFFAIKRSSNVAYWSSVVITYEIPDPSVAFSPSALAFNTTLIGTSNTQRLTINKGVRLTHSVTLSVLNDTAGVFSVPVDTVTAQEAMSTSGKKVDVVFTPVHTYAYGGVLRISSEGGDFVDTTLALTGAGGLPTLSADSAQVRFGGLAQGTSTSRNIKITS